MTYGLRLPDRGFQRRNADGHACGGLRRQDRVRLRGRGVPGLLHPRDGRRAPADRGRRGYGPGEGSDTSAILAAAGEAAKQLVDSVLSRRRQQSARASAMLRTTGPPRMSIVGRMPSGGLAPRSRSGSHPASSSLNAGSWRIGSRSESPSRNGRVRSESSIARRRCAIAWSFWPARLSQQAML